MTVQDEIRQRIEKDVLLARLRKKIDSGKADFNDTFLYSDRAGKLLGEIFSRRLPDIPLEEREVLCVELLRDRYTDINQLIDRVQRALDEAQNLHIAPQHAPFRNERAHKIGNATADPTVPVETQQRRAESAPATMTRAMHDDRMKKEADFRSRAGLQCYITRKTDGKCCEWCTAIAGRYEYHSEPKDIYRRHDNCGCSVTYENGRQRQDVWSKRTWEAPKEGAGAGELVVFTAEQAQALQDEKKLRVFDFSSKPGKDASAVADMAYINSEAFAAKFKGKYENQAVEDAVVSACRKIIKNRNGTHYEEALFIDAHTGQTFSYVKGKHKNGVDMPESLKKRLTNRRKSSIIMIHNHPNSSPLSTDDYTTSTKYSSLFEVVACGHNGDVYVFRDTYGTAGTLVRMIDGSVVNETVRDFRMSYTKYLSRDNTEYEARHLSWLAVMQNRGFYYERR